MAVIITALWHLVCIFYILIVVSTIVKMNNSNTYMNTCIIRKNFSILGFHNKLFQILNPSYLQYLWIFQYLFWDLNRRTAYFP